MDLIIAPNTVAYASRDTAPATGTPGWATGGNPAAGIPATSDQAYEYNAILEELTNVIKAGGLALDRTNNAQLLAAITALTVGRMLGIKVFTQSGTYAPSAGATKALAIAIGGGGGGANCQGNSLANSVSGGGAGGGGTAVSLFVLAALAATVPVTVGAGGTAGINGGTSSFGAYIGGGGGLGSAFSSITNSPGGAGGVGTGGNLLNMVGGDGSDGQSGSFVFGGGGGGSVLGGGGRAGDKMGAAGGAYGGGGGGAYDSAMSGTLYPGGAGSNGVVIVIEYS